MSVESIMWGSVSRKRKLDDYMGNDDDKKKRYELMSPMIYSCGREIHFTCGIDQFSIELLIREFTKIISDEEDSLVNDTVEIKYIVDSPGGCVSSILKFVDYVAMIKKKYPNLTLTSIATGQIASAGTIMCIIADRRLMTRNAMAMIHELSSGRSGSYSHLQSYSDHLTNLHDALTNIYVERSGNSKKHVEGLLMKETWYTTNEYLNSGFVDEVI